MCWILSWLLLSSALYASQDVGTRLFQNECGGKEEKLIWWNVGEQWASMGIGHCIWYPEKKRGPFEETFPQLLAFLQEKQVSVPTWAQQGCPWKSREEWLAATSSVPYRQLQMLLLNTLSLQAEWIAARLDRTLPQILQGEERLMKRAQRLQASKEGTFALIDYLNFKGSGLAETEHHQGWRWGLKQVLETMSDEGDPLDRFVYAAEERLKGRVARAPQEEKWLQGWLNRVRSYGK